LFDQIADAVAVIGAVGMDDAAPGQRRQQLLGGLAVRRLARRQQEGERPALAVGERVDLGVAPAPADADRLELRPLFRPLPSGAPSHGCCRSTPRPHYGDTCNNPFIAVWKLLA
jgi:hypothetical protein